MGDRLLVEAARRISSCLRESDTVARFGGDEFMVLLPGISSTGRVALIAEQIAERLSAPFLFDDTPAHVSASVGITLYPADTTDQDELLKNADQAMYAAKETGRNGYSYFTATLQEKATERARVLNDLRSALDDRQLEVYYQPIVELRTREVSKAEALLRWNHPERGLVMPGEFIPLAEESGLIVGIGDWVLQEVARQSDTWRAGYDHGFQISVNQSPVQLRHQETRADKRPALPHYENSSGDGIVIEITEGILLDPTPVVLNRLSRFRDAGMEVALDDFGTGYSSLAYLRRFDIDYLKIDRSFIRNIDTDVADMAVVEAIVVMAHRLGLQVVAEGVETASQLALLDAVGCDYAQGYLFSPAVNARIFETLLSRKAVA